MSFLKSLALTVMMCLLCTTMSAQAASSAPACEGIMFVEYNSTTSQKFQQKGFKWVFLEDYPEGTVINFTDNGWKRGGSFLMTETIYEYVVPAGGVSAGDIGSIYGELNFSTGGDQVLAYIGDEGTPDFIGAIQMNGAWDTDATTNSTSADPFAANEVDNLDFSANAKYTGPTVGDCEEIQNFLVDKNNWTSSSSLNQIFDETFNFNALPVTLLRFQLERAEEGVIIEWETASEIQNDYFTIQQSQDGVTFRDIGKVDGHGTTSNTISYHFLDRNPASGRNYYRLKQTDFNGAYEIFDTKSILLSGRAEDVKIYPTVSMGSLNIEFKSEEARQFEIFTLEGRLVTKGQLENRINTISTAHLSPGHYSMRIKSSGNLISKRFIKG